MNPLLNSSAASLRRAGQLLAVLTASPPGGCGALVARKPAGSKRLLFRIPQDQSDEELARAVARRKTAKDGAR
jgi:hypothetical protein